MITGKDVLALVRIREMALAGDRRWIPAMNSAIAHFEERRLQEQPQNCLAIQNALEAANMLAGDVTVAVALRVAKRDTQAALAAVRVTEAGHKAASHGIAALLSLCVPGLGQTYKGGVGTGILCLVITAAGYLTLVGLGLVLHFICVFHAASMAPSVGSGRASLPKIRSMFRRRWQPWKRAETR